MTNLYLDTSIFLSEIFRDEFSSEAEKILRHSASPNCNPHTSTVTINEIMFVLERKGETTAIVRDAIDSVVKHPKLLILTPTLSTFYKSLAYRDRGLKTLDSLHAAIALEWNIKEIASFDKDFDKIKEIKRIASV